MSHGVKGCAILCNMMIAQMPSELELIEQAIADGCPSCSLRLLETVGQWGLIGVHCSCGFRADMEMLRHNWEDSIDSIMQDRADEKNDEEKAG